ncbi:MAG: ribonuclease H-like domain-containing protein [Ignavibacteria bacterium]
MRKIILEIETCGHPFESLPETEQEYLMRYALREKDEQERNLKCDDVIRYLSLYPFTANVISVGLLDVSSEKIVVYFEGPGNSEWTSDEKKARYIEQEEGEILKNFWRIASKTDQFITFNGRTFDLPFLMLRSAMLKIKPARNLLHSRYDNKNHVDLLEQFTFHGLIRKFNLDFYCRSFGIESPMRMDMNGMEIKNYYEAGRIKEIAVYCGNEVAAIYELYKVWSQYLDIPPW